MRDGGASDGMEQVKGSQFNKKRKLEEYANGQEEIKEHSANEENSASKGPANKKRKLNSDELIASE